MYRDSWLHSPKRQEIADKLEYKTHSAVLKRINKIGRQYEKYSGLSFGFQRMT